MLLWKAVCSNKLLAKVDLVLFLNKCDILASKLRSGIRLSKYVRSFGERPNDSETAEKCMLFILSVVKSLTADYRDSDFRSKFNAIHREHSPIPRKFYGFCTSVTVSCFVNQRVFPSTHELLQDTTTTMGILASGKEGTFNHFQMSSHFRLQYGIWLSVNIYGNHDCCDLPPPNTCSKTHYSRLSEFLTTRMCYNDL